MQLDRTLAASYSKALFNAALKAGVEAQIADQAEQIERVVLREKKFMAFMEAPNIPRDAKEQIFQKVFGPTYHRLLIDFVRLLIRRGRLDYFFAALDGVQDCYREHIGLKSAEVVSAVPLIAADQERLKAILERHTGKKLSIKWQVDAEVLGGIRFRCGDILIDTTLSNGLRLLRSELASARVV
jgi:F-type H+-transporting ATPase subunit delta